MSSPAATHGADEDAFKRRTRTYQKCRLTSKPFALCQESQTLQARCRAHAVRVRELSSCLQHRVPFACSLYRLDFVEAFNKENGEPGRWTAKS